MKNSRTPRILKDGKVAWIHFEGRTFKVELDGGERGSGIRGVASAGGVVDGVLNSPMPGKVLKINFSEGQSVKMGETICVLEAMKMEYALKAPFDGKVKRVYKKSGESVLLDERVVEVEK